MFKVLKKDDKTKARVGILTTEHGEVETPSYVVVGTHAEVRCLTPEDILETKTQMVISNTYHLWQTLGDKLKTFPGLHKAMGWNGTFMTDSGGFQVFSLGFAREHGVSKIANIFPDEGEKGFSLPAGRQAQENLVRITDEGVWFMDGGKEVFLDAKLSMQIQEQLGADIILAFDECTSPLHDHAYTAEALARTHAWAKIGLQEKKRGDQKLYGIVQGGAFRDLREESARFIGSLPFDGFAIGGSLGNTRAEMFEVIRWTIPFLREEAPRHLLGIGKINDLFEGVEEGIDTFDCVVPTREARHGGIWTSLGRINILKGRFSGDVSPLQEGRSGSEKPSGSMSCACAACAEGLTRGELNRLFKAKDASAARLATIHNVYFFNDLMAQIRQSIKDNRFLEFKNETLNRLS
ncbi:MAG: tRNA guanosine(34) transglycosylase Tgt [Patescibacteria group bacterium]